MKRLPIVLLLLVLVGLGVAWLVGRRETSPPAPAADTPRPREESPAPGADRARSQTPEERSAARAERDALREKIARVLAALPPPSAAPSTAPAPTQPPPAHPPGNLRDRIGGRDALVGYLNKEFMPLAHECIERAQERSPSLKGMLALSLETISDEQLGAVVDVAEAAPNNEIANPELLECIRETAYSLRLPPPPSTGREKFMLTLPVEPTDGGTVP